VHDKCTELKETTDNQRFLGLLGEFEANRESAFLLKDDVTFILQFKKNKRSCDAGSTIAERPDVPDDTREGRDCYGCQHA